MDKVELNREKILYLLERLNDKLKEDDKVVMLSMYGGAVMCLGYELRGYTFDVDVIYSDLVLEKYIEKIAEEENIQNDWMNSHILQVIHNKLKKSDNINKLDYSNLKIVYPNKKQMLAMKLYSARFYTSKDKRSKRQNIREGIKSNDFLDAVILAKDLGLKTESQLKEVIGEYFKKEDIRKRNIDESNVIGVFIREVSKELSKE